MASPGSWRGKLQGPFRGDQLRKWAESDIPPHDALDVTAHNLARRDDIAGQSLHVELGTCTFSGAKTSGWKTEQLPVEPSAVPQIGLQGPRKALWGHRSL